MSESARQNDGSPKIGQIENQRNVETEVKRLLKNGGRSNGDNEDIMMYRWLD